MKQVNDEVEVALSGRELDAAVAVEVMGWRNVGVGYLLGNDDSWGGDPPNSTRIKDLPHYSTSIAAAMEVVEKMRERQITFAAHYGKWTDGKWRWDVEFGSSVGSDDSLPLAICRAALAAVKEQP